MFSAKLLQGDFMIGVAVNQHPVHIKKDCEGGGVHLSGVKVQSPLL
jgi:hypothetical protein